MQTAIAGSVDLRCYCLAEARRDGKLSLNLPDIAFEATWEIDDLPWDLVEPSSKAPRADSVPDAELLALFADKYVDKVQPAAVQAAQAFLYLYMNLSEGKRYVLASTSSTALALTSFLASPAQTFTLRSALPIGAGLGSSAAFSVCIASALLYTHSHLPFPQLPVSATLHHGRRAITAEQAEVVNAWAFTAEKINHGTPSGVDNTVSTHGGAIGFTKAVKGKAGGLQGLHGFKSIRFLLTDTKVPRDTKTLVAGVARRKLQVRPFSSSPFEPD